MSVSDYNPKLSLQFSCQSDTYIFHSMHLHPVEYWYQLGTLVIADGQEISKSFGPFVFQLDPIYLTNQFIGVLKIDKISHGNAPKFSLLISLIALVIMKERSEKLYSITPKLDKIQKGGQTFMESKA